MIDGPVGSMIGNGRAGGPMPHSDKHKQRSAATSAATFDGDESAAINRSAHARNNLYVYY